MKEALATSWLNLTSNSGCQAKCFVAKFSLVKKSDEGVNWKRNWSSSFYLDVKYTAYEVQEEFLAFDIYDTINGVGGVLGLCLGWSVFNVISGIVRYIEHSIVNFFDY